MKGVLPWRVKIGYGAAELGFVGALSLIKVYLLEFYVTVVGLKPFLAGAALALALVWDAISDPLMGILSDRTHTRIGRRIPYIIIGIVLLAFSLALVFNPPVLSGQASKFFYLLGAYLLFGTATTLFAIPYMTLGSEITNSSNERAEIYGCRRLCGYIGSLFGLLLPLIFMVDQDIVSQVRLEAIEESRGQAVEVIALFIIFFGMITIWSVYGREQVHKVNKNDASPSIKQTLLTVLKNRSFVIIMLAAIFGVIGQTINASTSLFYYKYYLNLDEKDAMGKILFVFVMSLMVSVPFWLWISRKISKKTIIVISALLNGLMVSIAYPLLPVGQLMPVVTIAMAGGFWGGAFFLVDALIADIVRHDTDKTGMRKEGSYFGFLGLSAKLARALGLALNGIALSFIGFKEQSLMQTESAERGLAIIFGPGVGIFFLLATFLFSKISLKGTG